MTAQWPGLLWALLLVPVALAAYLFAQRRRSGYAVRFTNLDLLANVVTRSPGWRRHLPPALYLLALTGLLTSLARPQAVTLVPKEQATVMLVMDVSGSMNATDVQPTRMVAAQQAATTFVEELPEKLRVGVVSFASTAQTLTRPTIDRVAVYEAIATLHAEGATAMGERDPLPARTHVLGGGAVARVERNGRLDGADDHVVLPREPGEQAWWVKDFTDPRRILDRKLFA